MTTRPANDGADCLVADLAASLTFVARRGTPVRVAMRDWLTPDPAQMCLPGDDAWAWEMASLAVAESVNVGRAYGLPLDSYATMHARAHRNLLEWAGRGGRRLDFPKGAK